jgi:tetratricopeptide (TPR) repeat protein
LAQLYGNGVHAYFARDYGQAFELLTSAIEQGDQDPRCYYFRGLTCSKLGSMDQAAADYKRGAELETASDDVFYGVSEALERVQGVDRLTLEEYRRSARVAAHQRALERKRLRYEQLRRAEEEVLRDLSRPAPTDVPQLPKNTPPDLTDPFSGAEKPALAEGEPKKTALPKPAGAKASEELDPFRSLAKPPEGKPAASAAPGAPAKPVEINPFGPAAKPAEPPKSGAAGAPAKPAETDVFGAPIKPAEPPKAAAPADKSAAGSILRALGRAMSGAGAPKKVESSPADLPGGLPAVNPFGQQAPEGAKKTGPVDPFATPPPAGEAKPQSPPAPTAGSAPEDVPGGQPAPNPFDKPAPQPPKKNDAANPFATSPPSEEGKSEPASTPGKDAESKPAAEKPPK